MGNSTKTTSSNSTSAVNGTQTNSYAPEITGAGDSLYTNASNYVSANPAATYNGPTEASFGPTWGTAQSALTSMLGQNPQGLTDAANNYGAVASNAATTAGQSTQDLMSPYVQATLNPTIDAINTAAQQQGNALSAGATQAGAFGDSTNGVQHALLDKNTQQNIGNATASAYNTAYNNAQSVHQNALQTLLSAAGGQATTGQQGFSDQTSLAQLLASMGQTQQQAGQTGINTQLAANQQNTMLPMQQQSALAAILSAIPKNTTSTQNGTTTTNGTQTTSAPDNTGFGLLGTLLGSSSNSIGGSLLGML